MNERKQRSYRERWGFVAAVYAAFFWCLRSWLGLRIYGVYSRALEWPSGPAPVEPGFFFRRFERGDTEALVALARSPGLDMPEHFVRAALAKGDVCEVVMRGDAIAAYTWSAFSPTHDADGVFVGFAAKYRYGYKAFTLPEYRGRHFLRVFKQPRDQYCMRNRGCTHTIGFVAVDNKASTRVTLAMGYRRVGFAGYLKWGRMVLPFRTQGARRHGFYFFVPPTGNSTLTPIPTANSGGASVRNAARTP